MLPDTQWYKLWIEPNGNVSEDDAGVTAQKSERRDTHICV